MGGHNERLSLQAVLKRVPHTTSHENENKFQEPVNQIFLRYGISGSGTRKDPPIGLHFVRQSQFQNQNTRSRVNFDNGRKNTVRNDGSLGCFF